MDIGELTGLAAVLLLFGIPIIAILTAHQRKMAQILHENARATGVNPEIQMLREEIRELKGLIHQQAIAIDGMHRMPLPSERIEERVG